MFILIYVMLVINLFPHYNRGLNSIDITSHFIIILILTLKIIIYADEVDKFSYILSVFIVIVNYVYIFFLLLKVFQ
jgi:hypothetical protein